MRNEKIVQALKELRELVESQDSPCTYPTWGICFMLKRKIGMPSTVLDHWIQKWPMFSGDIVYPVPCPNSDPLTAFNSRYAATLFNHDEYAQNRRELLAWLITNMSRYEKPEDVPTW